MNFIDKINSFGTKIYEFFLGKIQALPGAFQGAVVILILLLCVLGLLSLLKKSIKFFLVILFLIVGVFIVIHIL